MLELLVWIVGALALGLVALLTGIALCASGDLLLLTQRRPCDDDDLFCRWERTWMGGDA